MTVYLDEVYHHAFEELLGGEGFHVVLQREDVVGVEAVQDLSQVLLGDCLADVLLAYLVLQLHVADVL